MHFSLAPWDFFQKKDIKDLQGICSLKMFDPYLWSFAGESLGLTKGWKSLFASTLTRQELEEGLCNLSLFEEQNKFIVHEAEKLPKDLQKWIGENASLFKDKSYVFVFKDTCAWRKKWFDFGTHITIEAPKFWEEGQTLNLLNKLLGITMSSEAKQIFMDRVPFSWGEYVKTLEALAQIESKNIQTQHLSEYLKKLKLDKFKLAGLLATKQHKTFWDTLLGLDITPDELRDVFLFLQSHLFKMLNADELKTKAKLNKYEREVLSASGRWQKSELLSELKKFNDWELRLKGQDAFLIPELRALTF